MQLTGAEILCESLIREGVEVIFGYPGGVIMPVYDTLLKYPKLRHILVRHEQGAAHAAEGYARAMRKPGVCLVTSGPGVTNLVTGIADAMMDSVPIVCISGQVISTLLGTDAFQEVDVIGITSMITKHNYLVIQPDEIAHTIKEAFYIANTKRPGPVIIDLTKDAQTGKAEFVYPEEVTLPKCRYPSGQDLQQIEKAAQLINESKKPLIIAGHGVVISQAEKELDEFVQKADIPTAVTLHGIGSIPKNHGCHVGMVGMHGNSAPNICTNQADVLIALGMRFDDRVTGKVSDYAKNAKIIHVDIDPVEIGKNICAHIPIVNDVKWALQQLLPLVHRTTHKEWFMEFENYKAIEYEKITKAEINPTSEKIRMGEVINAISQQTEGEAFVVADVGQNQMFSALYYNCKQVNSFISSGGLGTMGFSLPAGIGVKTGKPNREVWVIVGDGGFQMTLQEMATVSQENLDIKIAILNNGFLGMVRQWQQLFLDRRYSQVQLKNPDFVKLSVGFGIPAERVTQRQDIIAAIKRARMHKGPYLIEFIIESEANVFPMVPAGASVDNVRLE